MTVTPTSIGERSALCRAMLIALALSPTGCGGEDRTAGAKPPAQTPPAQAVANPPPTAAPPAAAPTQPPPPAAPVQALSDLESLVAPIALYPDPLLAELLVASTYPLEVVQAARWLDSKPDPASLKDQTWDASILRLAEVPQVLKMMNDHLDWTTRLGDTFLAQPEALMNAVQELRRRARASGFLKDSPQQKVTVKAEAATPAAGMPQVQPAVAKKEVVYIEPAKSDTLYVPQYNPQQAYSAPLAPPPASAPTTVVNNYYPGAAPATATTTASSTDPWLTFGAGALVGGLLTWGIMEWTHNDNDWHGGYYGGYYPPVSHYYGGTVCRNGTCWNSGGGYDRGNVNYNKNVNVSGNEINIDRSRSINQDQLANWKQGREGWTPDARHRRGQQYPAAARERWGAIQQPGLAGDRLGSAQTLPANVRGFGQSPDRPASLPAGQRPSAEQVRQRLGQDTQLEQKFGSKLAQPNRPAATTDIPKRLDPGHRPSAWEGLADTGNGRQARAEERRGAASREKAQPKAGERPRRESAGRQPTAQAETGSARSKVQERRAEPAQRPAQGQRDSSQFRDNQKRAEAARPNAFEGARDNARMQDFSKRGAASRQNLAAAGGGAQGGGGRNFQGGGGGGGRFQGGGEGGGLRGRR
ncbi:Protein of unknown function [Methylomagnum ishizawai]|uniref:DUF3300 domain-containing protein n=1 Tax=Methylomagnum ishizawai TaxID=1760988 RepID=A0A1Y6CSS3_9GAMM|nr:DUF3300 domain-containing protein [Methylomagnum ishizawai]SMF93481.1 Protein of unknown function [Methylomagnum ishizawai]